MLEHLNNTKKIPHRVVILGGNGFVGNAAKTRVVEADVQVLSLTREDIDLLGKNAARQLASQLSQDDALVIAVAEAPCKNTSMLLHNIQMMQTICDAIEVQPVNHIIYISSDAVYADSDNPLTERSVTAPDSLHGIMHLAREKMLCSAIGSTPLACLRPSLLYGAKDPHNGYGPNQFRRLFEKGDAITLFGEGEEQRDHVYIKDVAELIYLCLMYRSQGVLNVATGKLASFREIAEMMNNLCENSVDIKSQPRNGPMPHNGYRPFSTNVCKQVFPEFNYTSLIQGLEIAYHNEVREACY